MNAHTFCAVQPTTPSIAFSALNLGDLENHSVPPARGWSYFVGQRVDHIDGGFPGTVVGLTSLTRRGEFAGEIVWVDLDTGGLLLMEATDLLPEFDC